MQFKITAIAAIVALLSGTNAITVCSDYNTSNGQCAGTCQPFSINVGQTINVPATACVFNPASDVGFDALICAENDLGGSCSLLSTRRHAIFSGNINWDAGRFTHSILRTGA